MPLFGVGLPPLYCKVTNSLGVLDISYNVYSKKEHTNFACYVNKLLANSFLLLQITLYYG